MSLCARSTSVSVGEKTRLIDFTWFGCTATLPLKPCVRASRDSRSSAGSSVSCMKAPSTSHVIFAARASHTNLPRAYVSASPVGVHWPPMSHMKSPSSALARAAPRTRFV